MNGKDNCVTYRLLLYMHIKIHQTSHADRVNLHCMSSKSHPLSRTRGTRHANSTFVLSQLICPLSVPIPHPFSVLRIWANLYTQCYLMTFFYSFSSKFSTRKSLFSAICWGVWEEISLLLLATCDSIIGRFFRNCNQ